MANAPLFNGEENLRRIKMDKSQAFILVEGVDDIPIYDTALYKLLGGDIGSAAWEVVHAGGKKEIKLYVKKEHCDNFVAIMDKDFDSGEDVDYRVSQLSKYSVENYFFCKEVVAFSSAGQISSRVKDVYDFLDFEELEQHYEDELRSLLQLLVRYQSSAVDRLSEELHVSWSESFLFENSSWVVSADRVSELVRKLEAVVEDSDSCVLNHWESSVLDVFPGKMLVEGVRKYINEKLKSFCQRRVFPDRHSFRMQAMPYLSESPEFVRDISRAVIFLNQRSSF